VINDSLTIIFQDKT